ncbi:MAG: DUF928 domain-containing protein [Cyanobacteria bacterium P01_A01_bin.114]
MKFSSPLLQFAQLSIVVGTCLAFGINDASARTRYRPAPRGIPAQRASGGTRGEPPAFCTTGDQPMTAVSPVENLGFTTEGYPEFQWYMPENTVSHLEFWLYEADTETGVDSPIYQTVFVTSGAEGIATLQLPDTAGLPPLEVGQTYHWTVSAHCDIDAMQADMFVDGWVERVEATPALQTQMAEAASDIERATIAADNSLWFDAIQLLSEQIQHDPSNAEARSELASLLESVGLDAISTVPLLMP